MVLNISAEILMPFGMLYRVVDPVLRATATCTLSTRMVFQLGTRVHLSPV